VDGSHASLDWAEALLRRLNPESRLRHARLAGDLYERLVKEPLDRVLRLEPDRTLHEQARALLDHHLHDRTVALGLRHGDFSLGNIHVQGDRVTGLIDWDDSDPDGIAMEDAISHLSSRIVRGAGGFAETFVGLATREALDADESAFLDRCYAYYGMDPRMHPGLVLLFWAHAIEAQLEFAFAQGNSYRTARINRVLELFTGDARLR
jgi:aminoglycoside phosphotransferase (APT) family kinase protein